MKHASTIIPQLLAIPSLRIECPHCEKEFPIGRAKLFSMYGPYPPSGQKIVRQRFETAKETKSDLKERKKQLVTNRKKKPEQITTSAQGSNFGTIAEQIIPAFITFPYKQSECRPLFEPVDYVIFTGLAAKGHVGAITFVDVKTGDARLSRSQRQIQDRIEEGTITHRVINK